MTLDRDLIVKRMLAGSTFGPPCATPNCDHDSCWALADSYWDWNDTFSPDDEIPPW